MKRTRGILYRVKPQSSNKRKLKPTFFLFHLRSKSLHVSNALYVKLEKSIFLEVFHIVVRCLIARDANDTMFYCYYYWYY